MAKILGIHDNLDKGETRASFRTEDEALGACGMFNGTYFVTIRKKIKEIFRCNSHEDCIERIRQRGSDVIFVWKEKFIEHMKRIMKKASIQQKENCIIDFRNILSGILDNTIRRGGMSSTIGNNLGFKNGGGRKYDFYEGRTGTRAYPVRA